MIELKETETFRKWLANGHTGDTIYLLLCGGDKKSQGRDIKTALRLAGEWSKM